MPQALQIVPKWLQPHVFTVINDNTVFDDAASNADDNIKFIAVFMSDQGIDRQFTKKMQLKDFTRTYGKANYAKYGQPLLMPIAELTAGDASVYCMRITADDATYSNAVVSMLYKTDEETGKFTIKYQTEFLEEVETAAELEIRAASLRDDEPDSDGFVKIPFIRIRMAGRGNYGNKFRFRIANNYDYEKDYQIKMFAFDVLASTSGLEKVATYMGAVCTSPKYNGSTLINDVLDENDPGDVYIDIRVDEDAFEEVYATFLDFYDNLEDSLKDDLRPGLDEFDPFFGLKVASHVFHKNIEIDTSEVSLDAPEGICLAGGSDGVFASEDVAVREAAITKAYCDVFEGVTDKHILSSRRIPADILLDANYPYEVKQSLYQLACLRDDALLYLDTGVISSSAEIENIIVDYKMFGSRNCAKDFQHYLIRDTITKKKVPVTMTYFYAQNIAQHFKIVGNFVPMVKRRATLTGHVKNSLKPSIEIVDMEMKETLYENRFNYWEAIAENVFVKGCQNTSQNYNSDLLEENNMHVLFELKRLLEIDCHENLYNFANAEERKIFTEIETAKFANWIGRKVATLDINFDMNAWEEERSILHCYVAVTFRTLNKRTIIEIDVNKRNFGS